ncbi:MAG: type II toxin-antitoxin system HicA family toxin [Acidobacteriota bacterium]|nr:type II toxin-antitoxin system HicA family toxin [Acidobacteriota bacterium]
MPKTPRLSAQDAEALLLKAGFLLARSRGSHRIYVRGNARFVIPFHQGKTLHPKIVKHLMGVLDPGS